MHHHMPVKREQFERGYVGCVRPDDCNEMAHGNIERVDRCRCGATRHMNINQMHVESTGWIAPDESSPA